MKKKSRLFLNIATIALCLCAIAVGVYSAKTASLNVGGTVGSVAHNCEVEVVGKITGASHNGTDGTYYVTPKSSSTDTPTLLTSETNAKISLGGANASSKEAIFGDLMFSYDDNHDAKPIVIEFSVTNNSKFAIKASLLLDDVTFASGVNKTIDDNDAIIEANVTKTIKITISLTSSDNDIETAVTGSFGMSFAKRGNVTLNFSFPTVTQQTGYTYYGIKEVKQNGSSITSLSVPEGSTWSQIITDYSLTFIGYDNSEMSANQLTSALGESTTPAWDQTSNNPTFTSGQTITFNVVQEQEQTNTITLSFSFEGISSGDYVGIEEIRRNGSSITSLDVTYTGSSISWNEIVENYNLTAVYYEFLGPNNYRPVNVPLTNINTDYWSLSTSNPSFNSNTSITFKMYTCFTTDMEILCYDKKRKVYYKKKVKDLTYDDDVVVWNFDEGKQDTSKPLWIAKESSINEYTQVDFSDGTQVKFASGSRDKRHRIYNYDSGKFEYVNDKMKIGTRTINANGEIVSVKSIRIVNKNVEYMSLITKKHFNYYVNGILSSSRLNNMYDIKDMKFVKNNKKVREWTPYDLIDKETYQDMRLGEQQDIENRLPEFRDWIENIARRKR